MLFITLVLSLILVILIVVVLKSQQQKRLEDLVEREQSLPPLEIGSEHKADASAANVTDADIHVPGQPAPHHHTQLTTNATGDWKLDCKNYRQAQRYEQALDCAELAWPQAQSYEQAALTIRAAIKHTPRTDLVLSEKWLSALYRIAAEHSLLHDKLADDQGDIQLSGSESSLRDELKEIEFSWHDIGVNELRLLTKTDRRSMIQAWGEPRQHISAKTWYMQRAKP